MSVPAQTATPGAQAGGDMGFDPFGIVDSIIGAVNPDMVTPEFIEQLAVGLKVMEASVGIQQLQVSLAQSGVDQMRIENEKARLIFEMQEQLPFEKQKLQFQERMQELQLQESQIGLDISRERTLQAQESTAQSREGTLQAQEGTAQAQLRTRQAEIANSQQLYQMQLARSQATGRNFTGQVSARPFISGV